NPHVAPLFTEGYTPPEELGGVWANLNNIVAGSTTEPQDDPTGEPGVGNPYELGKSKFSAGVEAHYVTVFTAPPEDVKIDPHSKSGVASSSRWVPAEAPGIRVVAVYRVMTKDVVYKFGPTPRSWLVRLR